MLHQQRERQDFQEPEDYWVAGPAAPGPDRRGADQHGGRDRRMRPGGGQSSVYAQGGRRLPARQPTHGHVINEKLIKNNIQNWFGYFVWLEFILINFRIHFN